MGTGKHNNLRGNFTLVAIVMVFVLMFTSKIYSQINELQTKIDSLKNLETSIVKVLAGVRKQIDSLNTIIINEELQKTGFATTHLLLSAKVYSTTKIGAKVIGTLKQGVKVKVYGKENYMYKVKAGETVGFINAMNLKENEATKRIVVKYKEKIKKQKEEMAQWRRNEEKQKEEMAQWRRNEERIVQLEKARKDSIENVKRIKTQKLNKSRRKQMAKKEAEARAARAKILREKYGANTGMWSVGYYVDEFGEPTKTRYIRNTHLIRGTFSNTATQDSKLDVKFLIDSSSDISIQLYEYAGNNPVKAISLESYSVLIQDKDRKRLSLHAVNRSDRLAIDKKDTRKLHNALMKGGTLKFRISTVGQTEYKFSIQNADLYENAYRILKER